VKTKRILESCRGKVLLIDEAYGLGRDTEFHRAVLDTIVGEVPSEGGGDMVVILVGYEDDMDDMLRKGNSGLTRRFSHKIKFDPYTRDELRRILKSYATTQRLNLPFFVAEAAADALAKERKLRNFGNAGAAINLIDSIRSQGINLF
jgi:Cdc6-like AAA superfamily ATPase